MLGGAERDYKNLPLG